MRLLPSLASADPLRLADEIKSLGDWEDLHFDIEDGNFTPNLTFGQKTLRATARAFPEKRLDVHLMTSQPLNWLEVAAESRAYSVCAHLEALRFPLLFLEQARKLGLKAGLALNLGTPVQFAEPFLDRMDYLLIMTAEPDGQGEKLNVRALEKAKEAAGRLSLPVFVDGGLTKEAVNVLRQAGAAGCVLGRQVFQSDDPLKALQSLSEQTESK